MGQYIPASAEEQAEMLSALNAASMEELFEDVPEAVRLRENLDLPEGMPELAVRREMEALSRQNKVFATVLRGAGAYRHYIPASVKYITSKEEFVTAYTPYQAEMSQGILQSIFEYQTMICQLTGMDAANASVYDGASAAAEAVAMCRERRRTVALAAATAHPDVLATIRTYCYGAGTELRLVPEKDGRVDAAALQEMLGEDVCCFYVQEPNFYGNFEDCTRLAELTHAGGAKLIMGCNPLALAVMKTPAACGADVAVGEGQPLGMPLGYGGPYLGFMAATKAMTRKLPGRIVGETRDADGNRAYVLTLQAREQHIRREKASSNICSNEALCALTAAVYLSTMGPAGVREAAVQSMSKAHYLAERLSEIPGVAILNRGAWFHEFVSTLPAPAEVVLRALAEEDILGGLPLEKGVLWCVTEVVSREELDRAAAIVREVCSRWS